MPNLRDRPSTMRTGEELDLVKLEPFLRARFQDERASLTVLQYPSGHSNLTYAVSLGSKEFVLRRPPFGSKVKSAHDMGREFRVLSKLHDFYPVAPKVRLHRLDYESIGLADLGKPQGYMERQVRGWIERYYGSRTHHLPEVERISSWMNDHLPPSCDAAFIHNDYKYDNVVLDSHDFTKIVGVLDWEMCTIGDPLSDLGTTLAYWIDPNDPEELDR